MNIVKAKAHASSRADWGTPDPFYAGCDVRFGFNLDAAADHHNTKCVNHFTQEFDALSQDWYGRVWLNPPYTISTGRVDKNGDEIRVSCIHTWLEHAVWQVANEKAALVACLLPASPDMPWFHDWVIPYASQIGWVKGRMAFTDPETHKPRAGNSGGSMLVVYESEIQGLEYSLSREGQVLQYRSKDTK